MKSTLLPILIILLFISSTTHAQKTDSISPIYLEGTTINVAGMKPGFKDLKVEKEEIKINNTKYKVVGKEIHIPNNRQHFRITKELSYADTINTDYQSRYLVQLEIFDAKGKFKWKDANPVYYSTPIITNNRSAILWGDSGTLIIYDRNGEKIHKVQSIQSFVVDNNLDKIAYVKRINEIDYYGILLIPNKILWEKQSPGYKNLGFNCFSENGDLVVSNVNTIYSYSQEGKLKWKKPRFTGDMIINETGTKIFAGISTPMLIDNNNGEILASSIHSLEPGVKVTHVQSKFFVDNSSYLMVYFYNSNNEKYYLGLLNEKLECISIKETDYGIERHWEFAFNYTGTNKIQVLYHDVIIDQFIF